MAGGSRKSIVGMSEKRKETRCSGSRLLPQAKGSARMAATGDEARQPCVKLAVRNALSNCIRGACVTAGFAGGMAAESPPPLPLRSLVSKTGRFDVPSEITLRKE